MKTDILVAHPYKHHAFQLVAGCRASGRQVMAAFPLYQKNLGALLPHLPGPIGRKASGYIHEGVPSDIVISTPVWQLRKLISHLADPTKFQLSYDAYVASKIDCGEWRANVIVLLQDHMPRSARAAKNAGIRLWSDQINFSYEAADRIATRWEAIGAPHRPRDESDNIEILAMADYVTAPSRYASELIRSLARSARELAIIPYGVDGSRFYGAKRDDRNGITILARANTVAKGGDIFLTALSNIGTEFIDQLGVNSLKVVILGKLDGVTNNCLKTLPFDMRIAISHGAVPNSDVPNMLRAASLFVMPTLSESMSLACLEAMQSGIPLIVTPFIGVDCFEDGAMGLRTDANADALSNALLRACASKSSWEAWGAQAHRAAQGLSWTAYQTAIATFARNV